MKYVLYYFIVLFIIFVCMYLYSYVYKKKKNKLGSSAGFKYIEKVYKLNMNESKAKSLAKILALMDSVILSIPVYIDLFFLRIDNYWILIMVLVASFIIFTILILVAYISLGSILKKKGW